MSKFHLKIVTPKGTYREVDVDILNIKTTDGYIGVLAHHIPLASGVDISEMNYKIDGQTYEFAIAGGFLYVGENEVTVIGNAVESPEEIDLQRAEEAEKRAQSRLEHPTDDLDIKRAELALKKALVRINVKGLK
jgi:F-type H+-transporting ATPase subunit epsilon